MSVKTHPRGEGGYGWGALFLGSPQDDTRSTICAAGTMHNVVKRERWTNPHQVIFTNYVTACGVTGTTDRLTFGNVHSTHRNMLCKSCFGA